jgi:hypothetical protein
VELRLAGLEPRPCMGTIAKRLTGRLTAAAERSPHLHTFLPELVVYTQPAAERYGSVLDAGDRHFAWPL